MTWLGSVDSKPPIGGRKVACCWVPHDQPARLSHRLMLQGWWRIARPACWACFCCGVHYCRRPTYGRHLDTCQALCPAVGGELHWRPAGPAAACGAGAGARPRGGAGDHRAAAAAGPVQVLLRGAGSGGGRGNPFVGIVWFSMVVPLAPTSLVHTDGQGAADGTPTSQGGWGKS